MKIEDIHFTFSDTIQGYVTDFDWDKNICGLETSNGKKYKIKLTSSTFGEMIRNLGEAYIDCTEQIKDMLQKGRFLYAYGIFYPEEGEMKFEAKHLIFLGREVNEYRFEKQDWWIEQIRKLGNFYLKAQFSDGVIDYSKYRTMLSLEGEQIGNIRQETDTISRLVYGFASAYLLTGDDRYLEAAETGTKYLREHMRSVDTSEDIAFWYHGIDIKNGQERKIFASEFGDDYDAIPAYEQIYALAGPTQTYRITGDPKILKDVEMTCNLFDKYFKDKKQGGYYSHIDPVTFDPTSESLGRNRARKNWNSVGDHAPAYLINILLATDNERFKKMLLNTADTIADHFQDYDHSPFVQEKFHEDWSHDTAWGWQQNRAVVGHNLKIAWNLTRVNNMKSDQRYTDFAAKIAEEMPKHGGDPLRGGWYDVVNRTLDNGEEFHRFVWHDRKAWWQQEQGILAYLILAGTTNNKEYLKIARESNAFYNAWFLDHDSGAIYFNVLANGLPYLLGNERLKGSHSMSGYHSFELAYLAAVYTNLLITKQHLDLYFKPYPHAFKDNKLRVMPDLLPEGSTKIDKVWINGKEYKNFDAERLIVDLPEGDQRVQVKVRIQPMGCVEHFSAESEKDDNVYKLLLKGELDHLALPGFRSILNDIVSQQPENIALMMNDLDDITNEGVRSIIFAKQKMDIDSKLFIIGAKENIKNMFDKDELTEEITLLEEYDKEIIMGKK